MRSRFWLPILGTAALTLLSAGAARAGSFFGPSCYGADYTYQYPNRSHNVFGCGPGTQCTARHPLFKHRWFRRNKNAAADAAPMNAMPIQEMPPQYAPAPIVQSSPNVVPFQPNAALPAPMPSAPALSSRIAPVPAPLPSGPVSSEPPALNNSGKPPF